MKAEIKSSIALMYDSEDGSTAIIHIKVKSFSFDLDSPRFVASIEHFYINENGDRVIIKDRNSPYHVLEISGLFSHLGNNILASEDFPTEFTSLIESALLLEIQSTTYKGGLCAYGSTPQDWVPS